MISGTLRISLIIAVICYFVIILGFLKKKEIELKYTLLWLFAGLVMGILIILPEILSFVLKLMGIQTYMYGLFVICIGFIICILMTLTSIVSKQLVKINNLVQEVAMLEKRVRELENED